jgi:uncharacterized membrane protein
MNWKGTLGAFLIGLGLPMFVFGAIEWHYGVLRTAKFAYLIEIVAGLISAIIGFFLVTFNERKDR